MPHAPRHEQQKKKNIALALALVGLVLVFFTITVVKFDVSKFAAALAQ